MAAPRIMIVTASRHQVPLVRKAKALGYEVLATDANSNAPALAFADRVSTIDARDSDRLLDIAREFRADAIVTEQTDVAVPAVAYVAERLGLPGIGCDAALRATDKWQMREACRKAGLPMPRYRLATTVEEACEAASGIGLPVIIKPTDSQGSRGVTKVTGRSSVAVSAERALAAARCGRILVEELMLGEECSIESFVMGDSIDVLGICDKVKCAPPYAFDLQNIYPGAYPPEIIAEIRRMNAHIVHAVGIRMGFTHVEMMITPQGVRLIEIAARGSGARVATDLLPAITGIDLLAARLRQALGEAVGLPRARLDRFGIIRHFELPPGTIQSISGLAEAAAGPGVVHLDFILQPGDTIQRARSADQRAGFVLAAGASRDETIGIADHVIRTIKVDML